MRKRLRGEAGFTLIEIMVVVFILGLLVTLVAPKIIGKTEEARRTAAKADVKAIEQALEMFHLDNGVFPTSADGLEALVTCPSSARNCLPDGYLKENKRDPWGNPYVFFTDGRHVLVKSYGADGHEGGDGHAADISSSSI